MAFPIVIVILVTCSTVQAQQVQTCGGKTARPWACRIYMFGSIWMVSRCYSNEVPMMADGV
jgi:hypothetical protein